MGNGKVCTMHRQGSLLSFDTLKYLVMQQRMTRRLNKLRKREGEKERVRGR